MFGKGIENGRQFDIWGPFYYHGLTIIPAWISDHKYDHVQYILNNDQCVLDI